MWPGIPSHTPGEGCNGGETGLGCFSGIQGRGALRGVCGVKRGQEVFRGWGRGGGVLCGGSGQMGEYSREQIELSRMGDWGAVEERMGLMDGEMGIFRGWDRRVGGAAGDLGNRRFSRKAGIARNRRR